MVKSSSAAPNRISVSTDLILNILFVLISLSCVLPLILIVSVSFTDESTTAAEGFKFIPSRVSLDAYRYLMLQSAEIIRAYGVTILVTVVGTILSLIVIAMFAYPLSRKDFKYRQTFAFIVFFTLVFHGGMVPWYIVCTQVLHLQNTVWAFILPYAFNGWYVMIMRTYFTLSIPDAVIESAKIDGAGEYRIFLSIILRLSLPALATIGLFSAIVYWNDWWLPLMLIHDDKILNIQYLLYKVQSNADFLSSARGQMLTNAIELSPPSQTLRMALAVICIGPIVLAYPFFQKYFVQGLTVGAVKG